MWKLANSVQNYDWGSLEKIPHFLRVPATGTPVAEVWMGTHPLAPSTVEIDGGHLSLSDLIARDPQKHLGPVIADQFGDLPFLVKFLASRKALSLQVHPTKDRAEQGFERESQLNIPLDDPARTYKDKNAKPEAFYALDPSTVMAGFRSTDEIRALLSRLSSPWARKAEAALDSSLTDVLRLMTDNELWDTYRDDVLAELRDHASDDDAINLCLDLEDQFSGDAGIVAPLILNCVRLAPGEVLYTGPSVLHAHVLSFGVEVMATSDNVIRAGLTPKNIDRDALIDNVTAESAPPDILEPTQSDNQVSFVSPVPEFAMDVLTGEGTATCGGPRIVVALEDVETLSAGEDCLSLRRGESAFVSAADPDVTIAGGQVLIAYSPAHTN